MVPLFDNLTWLPDRKLSRIGCVFVERVSKLRRDAESIWQAGVDAVDSERLVASVAGIDAGSLTICDHDFPLIDIDRIVVVGTGKAGAGMAAGFERAVGEDVLREKVTGWINVPADCLRPLEKIHLHPARPAGHNEPTAAGVEGALQILELVSTLGPRDLCVVLISGGGSALLPAPVEGISLEDKQAVTRLLMHSGATIDELNCVRKQLSRIKGGQLARATAAGHVISLIISDVIGDPLDVIASGPTVADPSTPADALAVLRKHATDADVPRSVFDYLNRSGNSPNDTHCSESTVSNNVIGNNATALEAAARRATELGYHVHSQGSENAGEARETGRQLAVSCVAIRDEGQPLSPPACVISGGEPIVHLVTTDQPRKGGRNQEVAAAALEQLWDDGLREIVVLAGGTDGEDGPTDAAGGVVDADVLASARRQDLHPAEFLAVNNTYPFLERTGGLLITGPTHTNVMDLRVALVGEPRSSS